MLPSILLLIASIVPVEDIVFEEVAVIDFNSYVFHDGQNFTTQSQVIFWEWFEGAAFYNHLHVRAWRPPIRYEDASLTYLPHRKKWSLVFWDSQTVVPTLRRIDADEVRFSAGWHDPEKRDNLPNSHRTGLRRLK